MPSKERPDVFMPLYIGDYMAGTSRLTTEQHGAYLLLIMDYWMNGPPPNDDRVLASITRMSADAWSINQASIKHFFFVDDGCLKHKRIEQELARAREKRSVSRQKAEKAAAARWSNATSNAASNAPSIGQALHEECPSPSPSPSDSKNITTANAVVCAEQICSPPPASEPPKKSKPLKPAEPAVLELLTTRAGVLVPITQTQIDQWADAYPAVDVVQWLRRIQSWLVNNPRKRKTPAGVFRFVDSWLAREQDKPRFDPGGPPPGPPLGPQPGRQFLNSREKNAQRNAEIFDYQTATNF